VDELKPLTVGEIAARLRERPGEVSSWIELGVDTPAGTLRLRAEPGPDGFTVKPRDLVRFIRARHGLPEPEVSGGKA
jgi:hypothetical protein